MQLILDILVQVRVRLGRHERTIGVRVQLVARVEIIEPQGSHTILAVKLNGKIYIDGGVLERVPCKTLRDHGMDVVIGVDVGYHGDTKDVSDFGAYSMLNHTISLMQWELTKYRREEADVMLVPEVLFVSGRFQTDQASSTIEEGRRAVNAALPAIRKLLDA